MEPLRDFCGNQVVDPPRMPLQSPERLALSMWLPDQVVAGLLRDLVVLCRALG
jgi:hypothetical protein